VAAGCAGASVATSAATSAPPSSTTQSAAATSPTGTGPTAAEHVVYAVGDDTEPGADSVAQHLAGLVPLPSEGLELFLYLGDVRPSGSAADFQHYDSIWGGKGRDLRVKTTSMLGNHETGTRTAGWIPYWSGRLVTPWPGSLTQTDPPYYSVVLGTWKFVILDTNSTLDKGGPQYRFLAAELNEPGYKVIVCGHAPRWSNGLHGNDDALDAVWKTMCDKGVVAYVSGHDHGSQIQPRRDGDGNVVTGGGCVQLVAAAGGAPLYPFRTGPGFAPAEWEDGTHFALLRLTLRANDLVAEFVAEDGTVLHAEALALP
jgi:hypothetical protein